MLIQVDASQLEWRVCLELCQDPVGIQEILDKADVHSLNQEAFSLPDRLIAKKYLFRTIFNHGKGYAFTIDPDFMHVSTSVSFWDTVGEKFYKKYNKLEELYRTNNQKVIQGEDLVGPLGRFWPIKMRHNYKGDLEVPETLLVNYPTQGTAADVMAIARISFRNRLRNLPFYREVLLKSTVHDSIVVDSPSKYQQEIVNLFHQVFDDLPKNIQKLFGYQWVVPLDCECKVGRNLKDMEKIKRLDK